MTGFSLATAGIAFVIALVVGRPLIAWLRAQKLGKAISDEGPHTHHVKAGTPTMGGLIIFVTVAVLTLVTNVVGRESILLPLVGIVVLGTVGLIDDLGSIVDRVQTGLSWRLKVVTVALFALGASLVLFFALDADSVNVPWAGSYSLGGRTSRSPLSPSSQQRHPWPLRTVSIHWPGERWPSRSLRSG